MKVLSKVKVLAIVVALVMGVSLIAGGGSFIGQNQVTSGSLYNIKEQSLVFAKLCSFIISATL